MLLALWGTHAIGKTTFLQSLIGQLTTLHKNSKQLKQLVIVQADLEREWTAMNGWAVVKRWKIPNIQKRAVVQDMVADDNHLYLIESARYFGGMYPVLVSAYKQCRGGVYFIIPVASADDVRYFIRQRCLMNGKEYQADYWGDHADYECNGRYSNPARKWFQPAGIPYDIVTIERDRKAWKQVIERQVWRLICQRSEDWYYDC